MVTKTSTTSAVSAVAPTFVDIDNEALRTYHFPDGSTFTIEEPIKLSVKRGEKGDSHRVINAGGQSFYVRAGWNAISWVGKNGPAYSF